MRPGRSKENEDYYVHRPSRPAKRSRADTPFHGSQQDALSKRARMQPASRDDSPIHQFGQDTLPGKKKPKEDPLPRRTRRPPPPDWIPPLAVGAPLGEGLSRLEEADRRVLQWEAILASARKTQLGVDLAPFKQRLEDIRRERDEMEESEENTVPVEELESTKRDRIDDRIGKLETALEQTESSAAKINIQAAIDAYKNRRILCWDKWTLIYAGKLVDCCPTYQSFTLDREERLDRYFEEHGEGWLWYEPPLSSIDSAPEHLYAATWANPTYDRNNMWGCDAPINWHITMGFRRVQSFHNRSGQPKSADDKGKVITYSRPGRKTPKKMVVYDDPDGPRCFFLMHLDSGASLPTLHRTDLSALGINSKTYPMQTQLTVHTVQGKTDMWLYEMRVDVCRHDGESLVGDDPVWPEERRELGGIVPVAIVPNTHKTIRGDSGAMSMKKLAGLRRHGWDVSEKAMAERGLHEEEKRLSGMLPFQVCYSAGVPGKNIWFGEDRRDVLGQIECRVSDDSNGTNLLYRPKTPVDVDALHMDRPNISSLNMTWGKEGDFEMPTSEREAAAPPCSMERHSRAIRWSRLGGAVTQAKRAAQDIDALDLAGRRSRSRLDIASAEGQPEKNVDGTMLDEDNPRPHAETTSSAKNGCWLM